MERRYKKISEDLRRIRKNAGLTQKELAEKTGVSYSTIVKYENGLRKPKADNLLKIFFSLGLPIPEDCFTGLDYEKSLFEEQKDSYQYVRDNVNEIMNRLDKQSLYKLNQYAIDLDILSRCGLGA